MNHKWKDTSVSKYNKSRECIKCGVWAEWHGGSEQYWEYCKLIPFKAQNGTMQSTVETSFKRPDCTK